MRLLLDTHALLWWIAGDATLSKTAKDAISAENAEIFVSAASAWEIATKFRIGKLPHAAALVKNLAMELSRQNFRELPITLGHAHAAGLLEGEHRDPFDRMLVAQAFTERLHLVSADMALDAFGISRLW